MKNLYLFVFILSFFWAPLGVPWSFSNERFRPEIPEQIGTEVLEDESYFVPNCKLAFVNYDALRRDFPELQKMSNEQVDIWVLENFAYVSSDQLKLNGIRQTEIIVDRTKIKKSYRRNADGRAAVLSANLAERSLGLIDLKGFGHLERTSKGSHVSHQIALYEKVISSQEGLDNLRTQGHNDGLMSFGEAIAELTRQTAAQMLFDLYNLEHHTHYETVETYFIISYPFEILKKGDEKIPAAIYGRQAHWRGNDLDIPASIYSDDFGQFQGTRFKASVDFGGVIVEDKRLQASFSVRDGGVKQNPQDSKPWAWGHEVAQAFKNGDLQAVYRHLKEMVSPVLEEWNSKKDAVHLHEIQSLKLKSAYAFYLLLKNKDWENILLSLNGLNLDKTERGYLIRSFLLDSTFALEFLEVIRNKMQLDDPTKKLSHYLDLILEVFKANQNPEVGAKARSMLWIFFKSFRSEDNLDNAEALITRIMRLNSAEALITRIIRLNSFEPYVFLEKLIQDTQDPKILNIIKQVLTREGSSAYKPLLEKVRGKINKDSLSRRVLSTCEKLLH